MPFSAYSEAPASVHLIGEKRTPHVKDANLEFTYVRAGQAINLSEAQAKLVRYLDVASDSLGFTVRLQLVQGTPYRGSSGMVHFVFLTADKAMYRGVMAVGDKSTAGRELSAKEQDAISQEPLTDLEISSEETWETVVEMQGGKIVTVEAGGWRLEVYVGFYPNALDGPVLHTLLLIIKSKIDV
ncbi:hypothetical protein F5890DRAFT_1471466 [Lentinula detonsa]|uniref:Uncharacterized protein n=1 Tax=Lentinula detonsa TaxID=2804962 RepID=A0AA38Q6X6_9AGAR|nr:hypothetical protein F5890DRAFT_1471466 [Lentinula detonsa]